MSVGDVLAITNHELPIAIPQAYIRVVFFADVVGQESVKERLQQQVATGNIPHAQLFLGGEGTGQLPMALAFAQFLNCKNRSATDSCGECSSCQKAQKFTHPDTHFVFPVNTNNSVKKDPISDKFIEPWRAALSENPYMGLFDWLKSLGIENKQGIINAAEAGEVNRKLSLRAYEEGYKIMLIWMSELMNASSANKLLKILEEPPAKTVFLLCAVNQEQLLTTIRSRVQVIPFRPLTNAEIEKHLLEKLDSPQNVASQIAAISDNLNEAIKLSAGMDEGKNYFDDFTAWMRFAYGRKIIEMMDLAESLAATGRENQKRFIQYCIMMIRESLLHHSAPELINASSNERQFLAKFHPFIQFDNGEQMVQELELAYDQISRNANSKILLTDLSLKMMRLVRSAIPANA